MKAALEWIEDFVVSKMSAQEYVRGYALNTLYVYNGYHRSEKGQFETRCLPDPDLFTA